MSKIVLWVSDLDEANHFYSALFGVKAAEANGDFHVVKSDVNEVFLHLLPIQFRELPSGSGSVVVREEAAIKPIFSVVNIEEARNRVKNLGAIFPSDISEYEGIQYLDCVDPEGNVIQLSN